MTKIYTRNLFFQMICVNGRIYFFLAGLLEKVTVLCGEK